ncbi:MAG TPA: 5'-3' exonuclease H3TH domain-containing protein [Acidimicrobiia bacterium]|nr:5'-3' exonuclease H3TH domain-containing protein [Acidimicrobiia bacterium]
MQVHLVDGTYELFRHFFAVPEHRSPDGIEVGATRGVVGSMMQLLEEGATHVGVATDHVIESFRNELWPGYKTGDGVDPILKAQFPLIEEALDALGLTVWAEVELEADDALASAALVAEGDPSVERVVVCTPDKDLAQCVRDPRVVQLDRRHGTFLDAAAVRAKFGVSPASIPDWLALVGDSADGFPGLPGWGAKSASTVLAAYEHLDAIPDNPRQWTVEVRGAARLADTLATQRPLAERFRVLATLRTDADVGVPAAWRWGGPTAALAGWAERLGSPALVHRAERLAEART